MSVYRTTPKVTPCEGGKGEVLCDNLHQGSGSAVTVLLLHAQPRDPLHMMGDQELGPPHLHLCHDQALRLPLTGIQRSLQLHAVLVAPGHALGWQQVRWHPQGAAMGAGGAGSPLG